MESSMKSAPIRNSLLSCALLGLSFLPAVAVAGDVVATQGTHFDCAATFTGEIQPGDLEKIRQLRMSQFQNGERPLCFDSAGGSFVEAIRIGDYLYQQGIPTAIDDGAKCLNSCAFAFLGGSAKDANRVSSPDKSLHLNAALGFGSPASSLSAADMTADDSEALFRTAMSAAGELMARMDEFDLPSDLAAQVLSLPQSDTLAVQSIEQARALRLRLSGYDAPGSLGDGMVTKACIAESPLFDPYLSAPGRAVYDNRVLRERGAAAHRKATYLVEATIEGVPSWIACQVELDSTGPTTSDATPVIRLRFSKGWTQGGNPDLRDVHVSLVPEPWRDIPFADFWILLPETGSLADAKTLAAQDASMSTFVDSVGSLPATTLGTEALLELRSPDRQEIQQRLTLMGFSTQGVDGIFGPGSRRAIGEWQKSKGLESTGYLDAAQRRILFRDSEAQYLSWQEEQRRIEQEQAAQPAYFDPPAPQFDPGPSPLPEPQRQRVRVCNRNALGELVNCRIEFR
jgi:peptidoglycan hydrolase-like protein with peptidoglycan-binding domain